GKVSEDNASDVKVDADETVAITGVEKVVLRHQDLKGKKDEQLLSNNMIEETASKLVEIQRSKVKALVGAFETLISLNEKKN
ncbi:serine-rich adhesin for platelets-like protein, partial [Trifolium pratense]